MRPGVLSCVISTDDFGGSLGGGGCLPYLTREGLELVFLKGSTGKGKSEKTTAVLTATVNRRPHG